MKRNKIKIISSILGCFALCGLFALSIFSNKKTYVKETKAYDDIFVDTVQVQGSLAYQVDYVEDGVRYIYPRQQEDGVEVWASPLLVYVTDIDLYRNVDSYGVSIYKMVFRFTLDFYNSDLEHSAPEYLRNINATYYSNYFYTNSSIFDFYFTHFQFDYVNDSGTYSMYYDFDFKVADTGTENWLVETHNDYLIGTTENSISVGLVRANSLFYQYNVRPYDAQPTRYFYLLNTFTFVNLNDEFSQGYTNGYNNGYEQGFNQGQSGGYTNGYNDGYQAGVQSQQSVINQAYNNGYNDGYTNGSSNSEVTSSIFSGIVSVGLLPINFFLSIFDFTILGINIRQFVSAILTICVTIIVIRVVVGKSGD